MNYFCSWSGGKDSCLALYKAGQEGCKARVLICMLTEEEKMRSHGLPRDLLELQADAMEIPIVFGNSSWERYEEIYTAILRKQIDEHQIGGGIFGDIDVEEHRVWLKDLCAKLKIAAHFPLWQISRGAVVEEVIARGFKSVIVSVKDNVLDESWLGRILDKAAVDELIKLGVDCAGEGGEYHSFVFDGPNFSHPVKYSAKGISRRAGYTFLELE